LYAVLERDGQWLLGRRPEEGLFGGLWEFIGMDAPPGAEPVPAVEENVLRETGLSCRVKEALPAFEHQLTHRVYSVRAFRCHPSASSSKTAALKGIHYERFKWIRPGQINRMGVSAITKRIVQETSRRGEVKHLY
jgi:A/G-specific adenine glycosylase